MILTRIFPGLVAVAALTACSTVYAHEPAAAEKAEATAWSYEGAGAAEFWGDLSAENAACGKGVMQSPIDLAAGNATGTVELATNFGPVGTRVVDKGYTVQAYFDAGRGVTSAGTVFGLAQVHFHTPSEHVISGEPYPMVAHFVHVSEAGGLLVVGVMYEEGAANAGLDAVLGAVDGDPMTFDPATLMPASLDLYRYMGSLTTPPCSEGVNWHVAKQAVSASAEQLAAMQARMGMNARPVQGLNNRLLIAPSN